MKAMISGLRKKLKYELEEASQGKNFRKINKKLGIKI